MPNDTDPQGEQKSLWRWATTPPQAYLMYVIALLLVWGVSFYAGTLRPKKAEGFGPPPVSVPQR